LEIVQVCHDHMMAGHLAFEKSYHRALYYLYWDKMADDFKKYVDGCKICSRKKSPHVTPAGMLKNIEVEAAWEMLGMDLIGPFKRTEQKSKYILVIMDHMTKWVEAFAIPSKKSGVIAKILVEEIMCHYGAPVKLLSDHGKEFLNRLTASIVEMFNVQRRNTTAYHPQTDGLTERFNHTLCSMLSMYVDDVQSDWDLYIPYVLFAYRTAIHKSTRVTPYKMLFGREARTPFSVAAGLSRSLSTASLDKYQKELIENIQMGLEHAKKMLDKSQASQKQNYDARHKAVEFKEGEVLYPACEERAF
jgi:hypothetical protein